MGAAPLNTSRAGTVRRVVRRGKVFICGLCRSHHADLDEAKGCVRQCWADLLALDPVIRKPRVNYALYRCRFCARDYRTRNEAMTCASECRAMQKERQALERELEREEGQPAGKKPRLGLARPALIPVAPRPRPAPKVAPPEVPSKAPAPIDVDATSVPAAAPALDSVPDPGPAVAADEEKKKKKDASKGAFYRDGAKYVCHHCHEKYFTKNEVVKCFDGHE